jgi:hypothetical protein
MSRNKSLTNLCSVAYTIMHFPTTVNSFLCHEVHACLYVVIHGCVIQHKVLYRTLCSLIKQQICTFIKTFVQYVTNQC